MNTLKTLSISIVNFNSGDYLLKCLESIESIREEAEIEIWVADNASSDNSLIKTKEHFPGLHYLECKENLGFGKAHNLILSQIKSEYILILNPDTTLTPGVFSGMLKFMEENKLTGAASCRVILENGSPDWASHRGFPTPFASFLYYFLKVDFLYHLPGRSMNAPHEVDSISGAFFLTRKFVLDKVGCFDEDFFLYGEDIDLCFRIRECGFKIMYVPEISIVHHKGISSGLKNHTQDVTTADLETRKKSLDAFYNSMEIFYKKHMEKKYPFFINWLVYLGINMKWQLAKSKLKV